MRTRWLALGGLLTASLALATGCGETALAYGDVNSIIAVMPADRWDELSDAVYDAFEKRITTVRNEKKFTVTYQEPYARHWMNLRRFRQLLVVGSRGDRWVQEVLDKGREQVTGEGVHQIHDVWSSGQVVNLVLLPEGWGADDLLPLLPELSELLDRQYREYARNRMYMSGLDTALADTLAIEHGFQLRLPTVYRWRHDGDVFVFRNDNPDPSELIREIVVTWQSPAASILSADKLLEWRARIVADHYSEPQDVFLEGMTQRSFDYEGHDAIQVQAQWRNPPELAWPAGGPFITRSITCDEQDRTYFIDAWLYAPGKEKYEYMIQLETILDTFRCGG